MRHVGNLLLFTMACVPSEGTAFLGNEHLEAAILCESRVISASSDRYWMTVTVKAAPGVEVDWDNAVLETRGATIASTHEGDLATDGNGTQKRMLTYRLRGEPLDDSLANATIGPLLLRYRPHGGEWAKFSSDSCGPGMRP